MNPQQPTNARPNGSNGTAVTVKSEADSVRKALEQLKPQMAMALPKHLTADRLLRITMTAVQNTPKLLDCDRTSLFSAVMSCAQLGLEPDGVLGQAYLVPFKGKVQFIPGYRGLLTLARNSGEISSIQAHEVCQHDEFDYAFGLEERLHHKPAEGERGEITHFYAYAKFKDGGYVFEVMSRTQVEAVRNSSEGYKAFKAKAIKTTPWESNFVEMGRKTLIRRLAKYLPLNVQRAAAMEDAHEAGKHAATDTYGDLVIQGEAQEVPEQEAAAAPPTTAKLDALAGSAAPAKEAQRRPAKTKDVQAPDTPQASGGEDFDRFVIDETPDVDKLVTDTQSGEIVPSKFVKFFEDGQFSVLPGYYQQAPKPAAKTTSHNDDMQFFGDAG